MIAAHLPGAELIKTGLADLTAGLVIIGALLVSIAAPGLCDVGLAVGHTIPDAEMQLYALLSARDGAAAHATHAHGLISAAVVRAQFARLEPQLFRFPVIDPPSFWRAVDAVFPPSSP